MAVVISQQDVLDFIESAGSVSEDDIDMYIAVVEQADACLDAKQVPEAMQRLLKLSAIGHLLTKRFGGQAVSQTDFDGASIAFSQYTLKGRGLDSTTFGHTIRSMDIGCFDFLDKSGKYLYAAGRDWV